MTDGTAVISPRHFDIEAEGTRYSKEFTAFLKECMETILMASRSLDLFYHKTVTRLKKTYKEILSGYCEWPESSHAELWLVIPCENMVEYLCIDETASSNGELYTVVTNRVSHVGKGTLVAIIKGVSAGTVIETLMRIDEVLNFSVNWAANAFAESFNAKFKTFKAALKGGGEY